MWYVIMHFIMTKEKHSVKQRARELSNTDHETYYNDHNAWLIAYGWLGLVFGFWNDQTYFVSPNWPKVADICNLTN